jgi:hypothetical protein
MPSGRHGDGGDTNCAAAKQRGNRFNTGCPSVLFPGQCRRLGDLPPDSTSG